MSDIAAFTVYKENASMFFGINVSAPIVGSGSLGMHRNAVSAQSINAVRAASPRRFTSGRARLVFGAVSVILSDRIGFAFQQSQEDLTAGAGTAYVLAIVTHTAANSTQLELRRLSAGLGSGTALATGPTFTFQAGTKIAVEMTWILDIQNLGGIHFVVKRGTDVTGFTDLTTETGMDLVSTTTVLQTSQGEGPCLRLTTATSNGHYLMECPSVVPLIVGG